MAWQETNTEDGTIYYADPETGESSWDKPEALMSVRELVIHRENYIERFSSGQSYYQHIETQAIQFEIPEEVSQALMNVHWDEISQKIREQNFTEMLRETLPIEIIQQQNVKLPVILPYVQNDWRFNSITTVSQRRALLTNFINHRHTELQKETVQRKAIVTDAYIQALKTLPEQRGQIYFRDIHALWPDQQYWEVLSNAEAVELYVVHVLTRQRQAERIYNTNRNKFRRWLYILMQDLLRTGVLHISSSISKVFERLAKISQTCSTLVELENTLVEDFQKISGLPWSVKNSSLAILPTRYDAIWSLRNCIKKPLELGDSKKTSRDSSIDSNEKRLDESRKREQRRDRSQQRERYDYHMKFKDTRNSSRKKYSISPPKYSKSGRDHFGRSSRITKPNKKYNRGNSIRSNSRMYNKNNYRKNKSYNSSKKNSIREDNDSLISREKNNSYKKYSTSVKHHDIPIIKESVNDDKNKRTDLTEISELDSTTLSEDKESLLNNSNSNEVQLESIQNDINSVTERNNERNSYKNSDYKTIEDQKYKRRYVENSHSSRSKKPIKKYSNDRRNISNRDKSHRREYKNINSRKNSNKKNHKNYNDYDNYLNNRKITNTSDYKNHTSSNKSLLNEVDIKNQYNDNISNKDDNSFDSSVNSFSNDKNIKINNDTIDLTKLNKNKSASDLRVGLRSARSQALLARFRQQLSSSDSDVVGKFAAGEQILIPIYHLNNTSKIHLDSQQEILLYNENLIYDNISMYNLYNKQNTKELIFASNDITPIKRSKSKANIKSDDIFKRNKLIDDNIKSDIESDKQSIKSYRDQSSDINECEVFESQDKTLGVKSKSYKDDLSKTNRHKKDLITYNTRYNSKHKNNSRNKASNHIKKRNSSRKINTRLDSRSSYRKTQEFDRRHSRYNKSNKTTNFRSEYKDRKDYQKNEYISSKTRNENNITEKNEIDELQKETKFTNNKDINSSNKDTEFCKNQNISLKTEYDLDSLKSRNIKKSNNSRNLVSEYKDYILNSNNEKSNNTSETTNINDNLDTNISDIKRLDKQQNIDNDILVSKSNDYISIEKNETIDTQKTKDNIDYHQTKTDELETNTYKSKQRLKRNRNLDPEEILNDKLDNANKTVNLEKNPVEPCEFTEKEISERLAELMKIRRMDEFQRGNPPGVDPALFEDDIFSKKPEYDLVHEWLHCIPEDEIYRCWCTIIVEEVARIKDTMKKEVIKQKNIEAMDTGSPETKKDVQDDILMAE